MDRNEMRDAMAENRLVDLNLFTPDEMKDWCAVTLDVHSWLAHHLIEEHIDGNDEDWYTVFVCLRQMIKMGQVLMQMVNENILTEDQQMRAVAKFTEEDTGQPVKRVVRGPLGWMVEMGTDVPDSLEGMGDE